MLAKTLFVTFRPACMMHNKRSIFCSLNHSYSKKSYIKIDIILNLFFFQNIETTTHQQQVNNVTVHSNKAAVVHADAETQSALPKPIIRPWEQLVHNKHRTGLGYDKDLSFHIPDYAKPIQFQSAGFIHDSLAAPHDSSAPTVPDSAPVPQQQQQIVKCQHCDRVGHLKDHCFDLHPCKHCHKTSHSSHRCFKNKRPARTKIHLGWIASWQWASTAKKIFQTHVRTCSRVLNSLAVEFSPSSHLVSDRGGNDGHLQASKSHQASLSHNLPHQFQSCSQRQRCP